MVRLHSVDDDLILLVLPAEIGTDLHMCSFHLVIDGLSNVMQKPGSLRQPDIDSNLRSKQTGKMRHLNGVLQRILTVAGSELHSSQQLYQLRMNAVYTYLKASLIAGFTDLVLYFLLRLLDCLLDSGRMNPPVHNQFFKCNTSHLTADRIKA